MELGRLSCLGAHHSLLLPKLSTCYLKPSSTGLTLPIQPCCTLFRVVDSYLLLLNVYIFFDIIIRPLVGLNIKGNFVAYVTEKSRDATSATARRKGSKQGARLY